MLQTLTFKLRSTDQETVREALVADLGSMATGFHVTASDEGCKVDVCYPHYIEILDIAKDMQGMFNRLVRMFPDQIRQRPKLRKDSEMRLFTGWSEKSFDIMMLLKLSGREPPADVIELLESKDISACFEGSTEGLIATITLDPDGPHMADIPGLVRSVIAPMQAMHTCFLLLPEDSFFGAGCRCDSDRMAWELENLIGQDIAYSKEAMQWNSVCS